MKFVRLILLGVLCQATVAIAAPIQVEVDRKNVRLNESFHITFSTTEEPDGNPDFSALEKEFEIIDRNHGSNSTWVNGSSSTLLQWTFDVMAKHAGKVVIPAVRFGSEISLPLIITVTEGATKPELANSDAELFLQVEATPKQTYVQSQILYTVRIYTRVKIAEGKLADPEVTDAVVTKLGEDKTYNQQLKDMEYVVVERNYAIFPQKSGILTIPALTLTAAVLDDDQSGLGGLFGARASRTERISSKEVSVNVLPAPANFKGHWLAAQGLDLKQEWSGDVQNMKVGEPLTRTLTLTATGATVGKLPKLQQATGSDDLKSYPDQPKLEEQKTLQGIIATREEKIAFIPSKAGIYTLPALEIPWFNLETQKIEIAKIPAVTVTATGVGKVAEVQNPAPVDKSVEKPVNKSPVTDNTGAKTPNSTADNYLWQGLAGFFGLGWLLTALFFYQGRKKTANLKTDQSLENQHNRINPGLKNACFENDVNAAKLLLIEWGMQKYNATTLGAIADYCDVPLRNEILELNKILYAQHPNEWDGRSLFRAFSEYQEMEKSKPQPIDDKLEPLHRL